MASINANYPGFSFIRVMDTASPRGDISRVSVYRSTPVALPDEVRILLGAMLDQEYPQSNDLRIPITACRDWGLPLVANGPNDALIVESSVLPETKVVLAGALSRNLTGQVKCGQVFWLQIRDGVIAADVQAKSPSAHPDSDVHPERTYTIERIEAKSITGRIIAGDEVGPPTNMVPTPCSIRSLVVGDSYDEVSQGIRGDILAYGGHIRHIESTGHIGTAETPINIHSGFGLAELFCTATENGQSAPRDVHADIAVNLLAPTTGSTHDYDGFVRRIRVSGSLYGSVKANIMRPEPVDNTDNGYEGSDVGGQTNGLFVGGGVHAGITLRQGMLVTSMIADEFTQTIEMETYLKGRVIARSGGISALLVGTHPHSNSIDGAGDGGWHHGFVGSAVRPDWDPAALFPFPNCEQDPNVANEPAAIVRAATSIGYLDISQMVKGNKLVPPMVEAPRIDVLRIGSLEYGVVWSGVRTNCTPQPHNGCVNPTEMGSRCGADPSDPASYAELGDAEIQSTAGFNSLNGTYPEYDAGLYVASFDRLDVMSRFMVHIHLRSLSEAEHPRIGCSFGSQGTNDSGRIYVHDPSGLHGQITINAHAALSPSGPCAPSGIPGNGDGSLGWWERVFVATTDPGDPPLDEYVLCTPGIYPNPIRPASSEQDEGPFYDRLPIDLGGGAIGQVPFHLHDLACDPPLVED
ncbi:MAG: hypothetical protein DYG92_13630, partial [Leptolyngbya sp. PLA1]|nr:hypothetical protein [Leptolyngbya sp. PLA1]